MMFFLKRLFLLICLWAQVMLANAQQPVLYSLTEKEGLTDNAINCFFEDSRGVMWMGTNFGLNSYDGSVIKNYHAQAGCTNCISNDVVNGMVEDGQQTIWLATGKGLSAYSLTSRHFSNYLYNSANEAHSRYYSIALHGDALLLATEDGLQLFDLRTKQFSLVKNPAPEKDNNRITKIYIDSKKRIWLCTYNGLWLFDRGSQRFSHYNNRQNDPLFDGLVNDIIEDHTGRLWLGTWSKGLKKLQPDTQSTESTIDYKGSATNVLSLAEQKLEGRYILWTNSSVSRIDETAKLFSPLTPNTPDLLNTATRIFCDSRNLLWIATSQGVKIYNPQKQYFTTTFLSTLVPLTSQGIALFPLKKGFLMGAEGTSTLQLFSDSVKLLKNYARDIRLNAAVMNIQQDHQRNFWLCSSNGLLILDSLYRRKAYYLHEEDNPTSLPKNFLNTILLKRNGDIWVMPWRKGVWQMDRTWGKFSLVMANNTDTLLPSANIAKAVEDKQGTIWLTGYDEGLIKFIPTSGETKQIIPLQRLTNAILQDGILWTVSSQTIFAVDIVTDKVSSYPIPQGMNKYEYDFIPDNNGHLWIATKSGLLAFNTLTKQFQAYTVADGLYNNVLDISFAMLSNGNILMAGNTYATVFSPLIANKNNNSPPLLFTSAAANGKEKAYSNDVIQFVWSEKNIQLSWALLHYNNPTGNLYYYKLDGVNADWQFAGNKGFASFNSLEPGRYTFHFKAATADGSPSVEKSVTLIVAPPFWKTWWFRLLAITLLGAIFYVVVRYISQRNLKENVLRLEKETAVEKERYRISRDMHDELGSGLTKIAILTDVIKTNQSSNEYVDKISETARGLVDNLDEMVWALNPKNDSLDKLVAYIAHYAYEFLDNTGIECHVDLPTVISPQFISEEKRRNIFMVIKEFLNNTVKHSMASHFYLQLIQAELGFEIMLKDDGKGFDTTKLSATGNGLKNMRQRMEDVGGSVVMASSPQGSSLTIAFT